MANPHALIFSNIFKSLAFADGITLHALTDRLNFVMAQNEFNSPVKIAPLKVVEVIDYVNRLANADFVDIKAEADGQAHIYLKKV